MREAEGHYSDALRWFTRGLRTLETLDDAAKSENRLRLSLGYAGIRFRQGALADCVQWCERAVEEARGGRRAGSSSRTPTTSCISRTPRSAARSARASATSRYRSTRSSAISSARRTRSTTSASTRTTKAAGTTRSTTTSGAAARASGSATSSGPRRSRTTSPRSSPTRACTRRRRRCSSRWTRRARPPARC